MLKPGWANTKPFFFLYQDGINAILNVAKGDLRRAITLLQSAHRLHGSINEDNILSVGGYVPNSSIEKLLQLLQGRSFDKMQSHVKELCAEGYPALQVLYQLQEVCLIVSCLVNLGAYMY